MKIKSKCFKCQIFSPTFLSIEPFLGGKKSCSLSLPLPTPQAPQNIQQTIIISICRSLWEWGYRVKTPLIFQLPTSQM